MKTCYFCKGPVAPAVIDYMASKRGQYVLVADLRVEKCGQCGEVYLDYDAAVRVDEAIARADTADEHLAVPVIRCK